MEFSLNVIGEYLGLGSSCIRIASADAKKFRHFRLFDGSLRSLRPDTLYIAEPQELCRFDVSSAQCGFVLTSMPVTPMGSCDYLYMDLPITKTELLSQVLSFYEKLSDWIAQFQSRLIQERSIDWLPEAVAHLISHPFYIVDTSFKVLTFSNHPEMTEISVSWRYFWQYHYLPLDLVERMRSTGDVERLKGLTRATLYRSVNFHHPFITYTLRNGRQLLGFLFVIGMYQNVTAGDIELTDLVGGLLNHFMCASERYTRNIGLVHEGFFRDVLTGTLTNDDLIHAQLHTFRWREEDVFCLLRVEVEADNYRRQHCLAEDLSSLCDSRSVHYDGAMVTIFHLDSLRDYGPLCARLEQYAQRTGCRCTISEAFSGFRNLPRFYAQAAFQPANLPPGSHLCRFRRHTVEFLLRHPDALPDSCEQLCAQNLLAIRDYDRLHGTDYYRTLEVFLQQERRLVDTAKCLFIHRNTLLHRLDKIQELFGDLELDDPQARLDLLLSFDFVRMEPQA